MQIPSSEYRIPIFISSTDYNLVDLRSELQEYLSNIGYTPILSSAEGFHDSSPTLEPWESCLEVLSTCPIMILVIDNKYGKKFEWPNFKDEIKEREVSPTHAEYLFAHFRNKRMLVYVRDEIMNHYQTYRRVLEDNNNDESATLEKLKGIFPKRIDIDVFPFIHQVKTTSRIPWIKSFSRVSDLKVEIHKKLLNELAEVFLIKDKHIEAVTSALSSILESETPQNRRLILSRIGYTKEILESFEKQSEKVKQLEVEKTEIENDLEQSKKELSRTAKDNTRAITDLQKALIDKEKSLQEKQQEIENLRSDNAGFLRSEPVRPYTMFSGETFVYGLNRRGERNYDGLGFTSRVFVCAHCNRARVEVPFNCNKCFQAICLECHAGGRGGISTCPSYASINTAVEIPKRQKMVDDDTLEDTKD